MSRVTSTKCRIGPELAWKRSEISCRLRKQLTGSSHWPLWAGESDYRYLVFIIDKYIKNIYVYVLQIW